MSNKSIKSNNSNNSIPSLESATPPNSPSVSRSSSISTGSNASYGSSVWTPTNVSPNNLRRNQDFIELANLYRRYKILYALLSKEHEATNETLRALNAAVTGEPMRNYEAEMVHVQNKINDLLTHLRITPEQLEEKYKFLTTNLSPFDRHSGGKRKSRRHHRRRLSRQRKSRHRRRVGGQQTSYAAQAQSLIDNLLATQVQPGNYTYIAWDEIPNPNLAPGYLHAFIKNIRVGADGKIQLANGNTVVSYVPPTPPAGSGKHTYHFAIYKQPLQGLQTNTQRAKYNHAVHVRKLGFGNPVAHRDFTITV